jgi:hypothetical protein
MKLLKNNLGLSLLEVTISAALVGGISLMLMTQQQTSTKIQSKMHFNQDLNSVVNLIQMELAKTDNCRATLLNKKVGDNLNEGIKFIDPNGVEKVLFKPDIGTTSSTQLMSSKLRIKEMSLEKSDPNNPDSPDVIKISFKAGRIDDAGRFVASQMLGSGEITKSFMIKGRKDPVSNAYVDCFSENQSYVETACETQGGTWDVASNSCKMTQLPQCMVTQGSCSSVYTQSGSFNMITFDGQRSCTSTYKYKCAMGSGDTFTRVCTCSSPNCTCYNGDSPSCFYNAGTTCVDTKTKSIAFNQCCRPLEPGEAPEPGYNPPPSSTSGGGSGCFVAGTQILLFDGTYKNIEHIQVGDELMDGSQQKVTVQKLVRYPHRGEIISINGGAYFFTPNHPFLTLQGWKSLNPHQSMQESPGLTVEMLQLGDVLVKRSGLEIIYSLDSVESHEPVYNFTVSGSHEYIADEYVVHNLKEAPPSDPYAEQTY